MTIIFKIIQMVVIVYKKTQKNAFTLQCSLQTKIQTLLNQIIEVNNLRVYLDRLIWSVQELANKGVLKPQELQGVSWDDYEKHEKEFQHLKEEVLAYARKPQPQAPYRYSPDKHNQRYGVILPVELQQLLLSAVGKAKKMLEFQPGVIASKQAVAEMVQAIREAVMQAYPGYLDLPEWEPTLLMLEEKVELEVLETDNFQVFDQRASVWWAGKQMEKHKTIADYIGKNEKSKIIVKIQKWGGQQPLREPPVDAETYQKMVKFYYKKVEETKEIEKNSVESHYETVQTKDMKAQFHLPEQIRYKPF